MDPAAIPAPADGAATAATAGLRYVNDDEPGIGRRRAGRGFAYRGPDGSAVRDGATLARIRALAIPPAWTEVWICADPDGHLQATGRDEAGRKQYRYHARFRAVRDAAKFERLPAFARALPAIRERLLRDLDREGLPREKVLAAVVLLLEATLIRVGNAEYVRNQSFGLTTLRDRHVRVNGADLRFEFRGKSGKRWKVALADRRLARVVRACQDLPGQELFQYVDADGVRRTIGSGDVNDYIRDVAGGDFTAKDFRTWAGTRLCAAALAGTPPPENATQAKRGAAAAIRQVAQALGNTPAVCRSGYVHPGVLTAWERGLLVGAVEEADRVLAILKNDGVETGGSNG